MQAKMAQQGKHMGVGKLVLAKVFHTIQQNWIYWLTLLSDMRFIPIRFF